METLSAMAPTCAHLVNIKNQKSTKRPRPPSAVKRSELPKGHCLSTGTQCSGHFSSPPFQCRTKILPQIATRSTRNGPVHARLEEEATRGRIPSKPPRSCGALHDFINVRLFLLKWRQRAPGRGSAAAPSKRFRTWWRRRRKDLSEYNRAGSAPSGGARSGIAEAAS